MAKIRLFGVAMLGMVAALSHASDNKWSGYLCCNMRTDGSWISDINYQESGKRVVPVGSPVTITGYGRYRVKVQLENKSQALGNDYSRELSMEEFARRYVVGEDPNVKINAYPQKVQDAIRSARLMIGMNREQVLMSVGYPVSSENPHLDGKTWRFWLFSWQEFRVHFDDNGVVVKVDGDQDTVDKVLMP